MLRHVRERGEAGNIGVRPAGYGRRGGGLAERLFDCSLHLLLNHLLKVGPELFVGQDNAARGACKLPIAGLHGTVPYERVQDEGPACPVPEPEAISPGSVEAFGMADRLRDCARTKLRA